MRSRKYFKRNFVYTTNSVPMQTYSCNLFKLFKKSTESFSENNCNGDIKNGILYFLQKYEVKFKIFDHRTLGQKGFILIGIPVLAFFFIQTLTFKKRNKCRRFSGLYFFVSANSYR